MASFQIKCLKISNMQSVFKHLYISWQDLARVDFKVDISGFSMIPVSTLTLIAPYCRQAPESAMIHSVFRLI